MRGGIGYRVIFCFAEDGGAHWLSGVYRGGILPPDVYWREQCMAIEYQLEEYFIVNVIGSH
ncbi:hypothetical protein PSCICE_03970 [Pseudomonas cichorii]|nr:hypothetical protein PSCICE_03970 [Pseudomonas cichorii]GFM56550.1 hypothetical protein PSCICF_27280 [Pseudomonas cichorii]